ncbi:MAG: hypothetical protein ACRD5Z_03305, partial [Bryobacteraceae bacterium]
MSTDPGESLVLRVKAAPASNDFLASPLSAVFWWGFPFLVGVSTNFLALGSLATTAIWAVALAWMGAGCVLNARRCHRMHCY